MLSGIKYKKSLLSFALASLAATSMPAFSNEKNKDACADVNSLDCVDSGSKNLPAKAPRPQATKEDVERILNQYRSTIADSAGGPTAAGSTTNSVSSPIVPVAKQKPVPVIAPSMGSGSSSTASTAAKVPSDVSPAVIPPEGAANKDAGAATKIASPEPSNTVRTSTSEDPGQLSPKARAHLEEFRRLIKDGIQNSNGDLINPMIFAYYELDEAVKATPHGQFNFDHLDKSKMSWMDIAKTLLNEDTARKVIENKRSVSFDSLNTVGSVKKVDDRPKKALEKTMGLVEDILAGDMEKGFSTRDYMDRAMAMMKDAYVLMHYSTSRRDILDKSDPSPSTLTPGAGCHNLSITWSVPGTVQGNKAPYGISSCNGSVAGEAKNASYPAGYVGKVESHRTFSGQAKVNGEAWAQCVDGQWFLTNVEKVWCRSDY